MEKPSKTNRERIREMSHLKQKIKDLEQSESERKRVSEALLKSEEYFKAIIQNSSDIILIVDKIGTITYVSPSTERFLGYAPDELIGKRTLDLIVSDDKKRAIADFGRALLTKEVPIQNVFRIMHKDGTEHILEGIGKNLLDNPIVAGFVMNVRDITDRKQMEEALRESEERYRDLVENASDIVFRTDDTGHITLVNPAALRITGYEEKEIIGRHYLTFVRPDMREEAMKSFGRQFVKGIPNTYSEYPVIGKDGREIWLGQNTQLIFKYGKVTAFQAVARDITERRRMEEALRESEERYRTILENIEDGYFEVDIAGNLTFFNDSVCRMVGYTRIELMGMNNRQYTDKENSQILYQAFNKVFRTGESSKGVSYEIIRKDGTKLNIESSVSLIRNTSGQPIGFSGIMRNITERKQVEKEEAILAEIGRLIGSTLEIDEIYERFAAKAKKLIPCDRIAVNLCNIPDNAFHIAYVFGAVIPGRMRGDSFPISGTVSGEVFCTRTGVLFNPRNADEIVARFPAFYHVFQKEMQSLISLPLISRDEVIGVLNFLSTTPNAYTERDLQLAERIGAQIAGAIANAQLFSDLKKTENSLRKSEGRFRGLVEQAAVGVAEIDMNTGRFLTVNRRLCEMVGRTEEELLATTFQAITHPEDTELHLEKTRMMLAGEIDHYSLEKRYLRKDGEVVWVNITVSPLWKPGDTPGRNMVVVEDVTDRKRMEEEIREMSLRDQMTELYNRRGFITLAEQQIRAANRARRTMLLTFIDCDGLKGINDTLGHEEGDRALVDTAAVLRRTFRESDVVARLGGDEFAVLSIDAAEMNPEDFSNRLQGHISEFNEGESRPYKLSLSWGTAVYDPQSPLTLDELMSAADERMYARKKAKANRRI